LKQGCLTVFLFGSAKDKKHSWHGGSNQVE
jgi:hypothetical protein